MAASAYTGFDKILTEYVGGHGLYQLKTTLLLSPVYNMSGMIILLVVFSAYVPDHRCQVQLCDHQAQDQNGSIFDPKWLQFAIPQKNMTSNFLAQKGNFDNCQMYQSKGNECLVENFGQNVTTCLEYVYDKTYYEETIVTKLNLVCDKEYLKNILRQILILGLLFGSIIGGWLGDKFGRKKATFLALLIMAPSVILTGFVNSYVAYATLHFIYSSTLPIIWVNVIVYSSEIYSPSWRYGFTIANEVPIGALTLNLIAYLCSTWTMIHVITGVICACMLPFYFSIPESPRWLAQNGGEKEALKIILNMAQINSKAINDDAKEDIERIIQDMANQGKEGPKLTSLDLFKNGEWKKTLKLSFTWIGLCISYYALSLNSSDLHGDIFVNFALSRLTFLFYIPLILVTSIYFGLKLSIGTIQILLGICCIVLAFIPKENTIGVLIVYLTSIVLAGTNFTTIYYYTGELYPTNLRSQAVGFLSMIARIFCLCAPQLGVLAQIWQPFPMVIIGIPIIISGLVIFLLPSTHKRELPGSINHAMELQQTFV